MDYFRNNIPFHNRALFRHIEWLFDANFFLHLITSRFSSQSLRFPDGEGTYPGGAIGVPLLPHKPRKHVKHSVKSNSSHLSHQYLSFLFSPISSPSHDFAVAYVFQSCPLCTTRMSIENVDVV